MKIGSESHKQLFCKTFMETHLHYEVEQLPFPELNTEQLALLQGIPFWEKARDTEREAGILVSAFANTITDPVIRDAIALQGQEEARHARLIQTLIDRYQIRVNQPPAIELPQKIEPAFTIFGFEECLDSFFAFGLFSIARTANILPEQLFTIFDPILDEEARHIVFFVNWFTYTQINRGQGLPLWRNAKTLWYYSQALTHLIGAFVGTDDSGAGFTATSADSFSLDEITPEQFVTVCLLENQKRMSKFNADLLQPKLLAHLSNIALPLLQLMSRSKQPVQSRNFN